MNNYRLCDTHCDTASEALDKGFGLFENPLQLDLKRTRLYRHYTQFFAAFIAPEYYENPYKRCCDIIGYIHSQAEKNSDTFALCTCLDDIKKAEAQNKTAGLISIEGGEAIEDICALRNLYNMGARMLTLTWNNDNRLGGGAFGDGRGLSGFGKDVILEMNRLGMIVDLSHASEKTFYDACAVTNKPVIASHSNAFELCAHKRNLKKEQFEEIKRLSGVVGINFYPVFLSDSGRAATDDIVAHIEYFLSLGGEDNICIGSDFDGIDTLPDGINDVAAAYNIFEALIKKGISEEIIHKIAYKNIYRVIGICL